MPTTATALDLLAEAENLLTERARISAAYNRAEEDGSPKDKERAYEAMDENDRSCAELLPAIAAKLAPFASTTRQLLVRISDHAHDSTWGDHLGHLRGYNVDVVRHDGSQVAVHIDDFDEADDGSEALLVRDTDGAHEWEPYGDQFAIPFDHILSLEIA